MLAGQQGSDLEPAPCCAAAQAHALLPSLCSFIRGDAGMKSAFATRLAGSGESCGGPACLWCLRCPSFIPLACAVHPILAADLYAMNNRRPYHSINFVIAHDGFKLAGGRWHLLLHCDSNGGLVSPPYHALSPDLVSYNEKHNESNGEGGRDGTNDNFSWNCGVEGPTDNAAVLSLRARQVGTVARRGSGSEVEALQKTWKIWRGANECS